MVFLLTCQVYKECIIISVSIYFFTEFNLENRVEFLECKTVPLVYLVEKLIEHPCEIPAYLLLKQLILIYEIKIKLCLFRLLTLILILRLKRQDIIYRLHTKCLIYPGRKKRHEHCSHKSRLILIHNICKSLSEIKYRS